MCFYAEPNYRGTRICKGAGETATFEDIDSVDMNDALSSVTVDCSLTVITYKHPISYMNGGASRLYTGNVADLPDDFDNRISHFVVNALKQKFVSMNTVTTVGDRCVQELVQTYAGMQLMAKV